VARGGVQTDKTAPSVTEFDNELKALTAGRPITAEELEHAKVRWVRGYAQQFESLDRIAGQIGDLWTLGMPMSELQRRYDAMNRMTLEPVAAAAGQHVRPQASAMLLVGDRSKVEAAVRDLKLGDVVVLDVEGKPAGTNQ
jgi:predicted Zn-dependent peptidase